MRELRHRPFLRRSLLLRALCGGRSSFLPQPLLFRKLCGGLGLFTLQPCLLRTLRGLSFFLRRLLLVGVISDHRAKRAREPHSFPGARDCCDKFGRSASRSPAERRCSSLGTDNRENAATECLEFSMIDFTRPVDQVLGLNSPERQWDLYIVEERWHEYAPLLPLFSLNLHPVRFDGVLGPQNNYALRLSQFVLYNLDPLLAGQDCAVPPNGPALLP